MLCAASIALPNPSRAQSSPGAVSPVPVRIAAGPVSEPMFAAAAIIANLISNPPGGPACPADAICGPAGVVGEARSMLSIRDNLESLAIGESETAFVDGDLAWHAYSGLGRFAGRPLGDLRNLAVLYAKPLFLVVRAGSPLQKISDLRRKTVALAAVESAHAPLLNAVFAQYGLRERDMTMIHLSLENAAASLKEGEVDAAIVLAPSLPEPFKDVAESTPLRLLPVDGAPAQALLRQQPYLIAVEIADLAEGRRRAQGVAVPVLWVTTQRLPAPIGYGLVRSLQAPANRVAVSQALPQSSAIAAPEALTDTPIPVHIGAARWAEEASGAVR